MPGRLSMVKPGAGMTLLTTKTMFDAKLDLEAQAKIGKEEDGVTTDALALDADDGADDHAFAGGCGAVAGGVGG